MAEVPQQKRQGATVCWCFTSQADLPPPFETWCKYLTYQQEIAPTTQRKHWQGYLQLHVRQRLSFFKSHAYFGKVHLEPMRGTAAQATAYCHKEATAVPGTRAEFGVQQDSGVTNGYQAMVIALKKNPQAFDKKEHYAEYLKHKRSIDEEIKESKKLKAEDIECVLSRDGPFHPWQETLLHHIQGDPCNREVIWVVDQIGGTGKTQFSKWLRKYRQAIIVGTTKCDRIIYAMEVQPPIVIFDIKRAEGKENELNYSTLETVKDGCGFQTMYKPETIQWKSPHVIVFSNFRPRLDQLSADRWTIFDITHPELTLEATHM